jgi:hypothetical protein
MINPSYAILSVDPGKATGVALITWTGGSDDLPVKVYSMESQPEDFAADVRAVMAQFKNSLSFKVVCERFIINAATVRNSQAPYSLEQIGVLKHLCREEGYPVEGIWMQNPVDAKNMFPNEALKKVGTWHVGGEGHANDAIRHALLALAKQGWVPRVLLDKEK